MSSPSCALATAGFISVLDILVCSMLSFLHSSSTTVFLPYFFMFSFIVFLLPHSHRFFIKTDSVTFFGPIPCPQSVFVWFHTILAIQTQRIPCKPNRNDFLLAFFFRSHSVSSASTSASLPEGNRTFLKPVYLSVKSSPASVSSPPWKAKTNLLLHIKALSKSSYIIHFSEWFSISFLKKIISLRCIHWKRIHRKLTILLRELLVLFSPKASLNDSVDIWLLWSNRFIKKYGILC